MKTNQLKLFGASLAASFLLGIAGCHSNGGMPQTGNNTPTDSVNNKKLDSATGGQNTTTADTNKKDTVGGRMGTTAK